MRFVTIWLSSVPSRRIWMRSWIERYSKPVSHVRPIEAIISEMMSARLMNRSACTVVRVSPTPRAGRGGTRAARLPRSTPRISSSAPRAAIEALRCGTLRPVRQ